MSASMLTRLLRKPKTYAHRKNSNQMIESHIKIVTAIVSTNDRPFNKNRRLFQSHQSRSHLYHLYFRGKMSEREKFEKMMSHCYKLMIEKETEKAMNILAEVLPQKLFRQYFKFTGIGQVQTWRLRYPLGPLQWLKEEYWKLSRNPFDVFNICCTVRVFLQQETSDKMIDKLGNAMIRLHHPFELYIGLGHLQSQQGQWLQAQSNYTIAFLIEPQFVNVSLSKMWSALHFGHRQGMREHGATVLKRDPQNIAARFIYMLGSLSPHKQLSEVEAFMNEHPQFYRCQLYLASKKKTMAEALPQYKRVLSLEPKSAYVHALIAQSYLNHEDLEGAIQHINKAFNIIPKYEQAMEVLAGVEQAKKDYEKTLRICQQIIELYPSNFKAVKQMALLHLHQFKDSTQALKLYRRYLQLNHYNPQDFYNVAMMLSQSQLYEKSIYLQRTVGLQPQHLGGIKQLVHLYLTSSQADTFQSTYQKHNRIIELCTAGLNLQPTFALFYQGLAEIYYMASQYQQAEQWATLGLAHSKGRQQEMTFQLTMIYLRMKKIEQSVEHYLKWAKIAKTIKPVPMYNQLLLKLIPRQRLRQVVVVVSKKMPINVNNIFGFMQLAHLAAQLLMLQTRHQLEDIGMKLHREQFVSQEMEQFVKKQIMIQSE